MIEKRHKAFVTSNGLVPVDAVCNSIGSGKTMFSLQQIYPKLTKEDVFECIHFYADNTQFPQADSSALLDVQDVGEGGQITIEVTNLHQIVYLKLMSKGHQLYPEIEDFAQLMNQGLRIATLENIEAKEAGQEVNNELNYLVNDAMLRTVPKVMMETEETKNDLDFDEFNKRRNTDET